MVFEIPNKSSKYMNKKGRLLFILLLAFLIMDCAPRVSKKTTVQSEALKAPEQTEQHEQLSPQEQKIRSLEVFKKILRLRESATGPEVVKEAEALYNEIIQKYPASPLAQESYLHLIKLYLRDYSPPEIQKAETVYSKFIEQYPTSPLRARAEDLMTRFYYGFRMWKKLIHLHKGRIKKFAQTGNIDNIDYLFFYSEALYHLGDLQEAEKGYKWVIKKAPQSNTALKAKNRLQEIEALKSRQQSPKP